jgi:hypothetical protein
MWYETQGVLWWSTNCCKYFSAWFIGNEDCFYRSHTPFIANIRFIIHFAEVFEKASSIHGSGNFEPGAGSIVSAFATEAIPGDWVGRKEKVAIIGSISNF